MKIRRNYNYPDAYFLEFSDVVGATLPEDLPVFSAFDASFTDDYVTRLLQAIEDAKAIPTDEVLQSQGEEETEKVNRALSESYEGYKNLAYFVRKAFKDSPAVRNEFGAKEVQKVRHSQPKMILFMESLAKTAAKYSAELVQVGCQQSLIDGLAERAAELHDTNVAQEQAKDNRSLQAQNRVELLNKVYALLRPLDKAARFVFADNPSKLNIYTLPKRPKSPEGDEEVPEEDSEG